ncbi:hypothetical protein [Streptomyces sp. NPDC007346]|uniref:hypothetical protein n=1 Tax=Streptomyces sp. NPDC007346 TaxID=3154682 RepID=UPI0034520D80
MSTVTRDPDTGLRRGPIRYPDGTPPAPFGCRWCGIEHGRHAAQWSRSVGLHIWTRPTSAQHLARMQARLKARRAARNPFAGLALHGQAAAQTIARHYGWAAPLAPVADVRPERCEEMTHNSVGSETFCTWQDPDHDGLCDDGEGFTWLGVRNEERGEVQ